MMTARPNRHSCGRATMTSRDCRQRRQPPSLWSCSLICVGSRKSIMTYCRFVDRQHCLVKFSGANTGFVWCLRSIMADIVVARSWPHHCAPVIDSLYGHHHILSGSGTCILPTRPTAHSRCVCLPALQRCRCEFIDVPSLRCCAALGVRMEDTLATLGQIHEETMPDSRFIRPKRLTFEQAGAVQY